MSNPKYVVLPLGGFSMSSELFELDEVKPKPGAPKYSKVATGPSNKIDELCVKLNGAEPETPTIIFQGKPLTKEQIDAFIDAAQKAFKEAGVFA